ncbi:MAG: hypothetical protein ACHQ50_17080 [Fimbriimonadales bacterium]
MRSLALAMSAEADRLVTVASEADNRIALAESETRRLRDLSDHLRAGTTVEVNRLHEQVVRLEAENEALQKQIRTLQISMLST